MQLSIKLNNIRYTRCRVCVGWAREQYKLTQANTGGIYTPVSTVLVHKHCGELRIICRGKAWLTQKRYSVNSNFTPKYNELSYRNKSRYSQMEHAT